MIKVFEMFAGYGTTTFALKKLGIQHEVVGFSEIDKYAIQCFLQNHGSKNFGDCTKINTDDLPDFDLLSGGFPCQAFSQAGKQQGELDPRGTLFNEIIRIAEAKKPKFMLLENVKGLTTKKFKGTFDKILSELDRIGYDVHWQVVNTKDYGIPQNRARVFFVCIDRASTLPEDRKFVFPEKEELRLKLKDLLVSEVDKKYWLSERAIKGIVNSRYVERKPQTSDVCDTLKVGGDVKCIFPALTTELSHSTSNTFTPELFKEKIGEYRRLTPIECFRLQGFLEDEVNLQGLSDTQCYKLAGNGQSVNVVTKIYKNLLEEKR